MIGINEEAIYEYIISLFEPNTSENFIKIICFVPILFKYYNQYPSIITNAILLIVKFLKHEDQYENILSNETKTLIASTL